MAGVAVVTDSTASLSRGAASASGIRVVPLQVVIEEVSRPEATPDGGQDAISPGEVAAALRGGQRVTTSRPTVEVFAATYAALAAEGCLAAVSVHLSSAMSGTVEAAEMAAASAPLPVTVVDSRTLAMATGFAALAAAEAARSGAGMAETAEAARAQAAATTTWFSVPSLEYLRRGGRIGTAAALLGSALAVKPLLTVRDGAVVVAERVRTASRALARLEELSLTALGAAAGAALEVDVAVHHLDDVDGAERLAASLATRVPTARTVVVAEISAVLGVHTGPGTLGVVVAPRVGR
ncbi:MAG: DegV family protein [Actinomycetes bacterium]